MSGIIDSSLWLTINRLKYRVFCGASLGGVNKKEISMAMGRWFSPLLPTPVLGRDQLIGTETKPDLLSFIT